MELLEFNYQKPKSFKVGDKVHLLDPAYIQSIGLVIDTSGNPVQWVLLKWGNDRNLKWYDANALVKVN
jgi:hypothetical protein